MTWKRGFAAVLLWMPFDVDADGRRLEPDWKTRQDKTRHYTTRAEAHVEKAVLPNPALRKGVADRQMDRRTDITANSIGGQERRTTGVSTEHWRTDAAIREEQ